MNGRSTYTEKYTGNHGVLNPFCYNMYHMQKYFVSPFFNFVLMANLKFK